MKKKRKDCWTHPDWHDWWEDNVYQLRKRTSLLAAAPARRLFSTDGLLLQVQGLFTFPSSFSLSLSLSSLLSLFNQVRLVLPLLPPGLLPDVDFTRRR